MDGSPKALQSPSVSYHLDPDPFPVPPDIRRGLTLNPSIFELRAEDTRNYPSRAAHEQDSQVEMLNPLVMNSAIIRMLMVEKMLSLLVVVSVMLSVVDVYWAGDGQREDVLLLSVAVSAVMGVLMAVEVHLYGKHMASLNTEDNWLWIKSALRLLLVTCGATPWTIPMNAYLHVGTLLRLLLPYLYFVRSSIFYTPRAARILNIYGMKPQSALPFAWKSILDGVRLRVLIFSYVGVVIFYSHCLYLAYGKEFIDCFEIVIVTLPTVGFGDYTVTGVIPRAVMICVVITGAALNAFLTLVMLKNFEMDSGESNSYTLREKLMVAEELESISSNFIAQRMGHNKHLPSGMQNYRETVKQLKTKYQSLQLNDQSMQFSTFRQRLETLKLKMLQSHNMSTLLLQRLASRQSPRATKVNP